MPETGLLDPSSARRIAAGLDLRPTKQRGQNFVVDANTVRRIVALSGIGPDDVVLEIGPGLGSLTLGLLEVARALAVTDLPGQAPTAVVANLPYNVSVPVLLHLLEHFPSWRRGLVMVQLEVADRLAAQPGSKVYGAPSAKLAWWASATRAGTVPPKVFWPVPNVDSGLVRLERHAPPETTATRQQVFAVIDAAFASRRKMLRAALSGLFGGSAAAAEAIESAGLDPQVRGEVLDVAAFAAIASRLADGAAATLGPDCG